MKGATGAVMCPLMLVVAAIPRGAGAEEGVPLTAGPESGGALENPEDGSTEDLCAEVRCDHGRCVVVDGRAMCECDEGFVSLLHYPGCISAPTGDSASTGDSQPTGESVPTDPCEELSCGPYGRCEVAAGRPRCSCDPGFVSSGDYTSDPNRRICVPEWLQDSPWTVSRERSRRISGSILIGFGALFTLAGIGAVIAAAVSGYEESAFAGMGVLAGGLVLIFPGALMVRRANLARHFRLEAPGGFEGE